jgi:hypothetical protein
MRLALLFAVSPLALPLAAQQPSRPGPAPSDTLRAFESDAQLLTYFRELRAEQERIRRERDKAYRRWAEQQDKCRKDPVVLTVTSRSDTAKAAAGAVIGGRVTNGDGDPQQFAQVSIPALKIGTTSGADGRFRLTFPAESLASPRQVTLRAARIGYLPATRTLTISRRDSVDVTLKLCGGAVALEMASVSAAITVDGAQLASRAAPADEQITNTQHAGVDEGGIVKVHGDHLVMLRRGRLFTVAIGGSDLSATAAVDAFGPDINPRGTWYDELLVAGDKVVVIGYSYERGGTEVGVFDIDGRGRLKYSATYQLRSNDYYSARNYSSRLIGTKLIFYAPLYLWANPDDVLAALPAARRWYRGAKDSAFKRIAPAPRIYRSPQLLSADDIALHTVTVCDLVKTDLGCEATVIVGPSGRVFYVSPSAVYVWASPWSWRSRGDERGMLYRMPLDGTAPSALGVAGSPVDQFSFLESEDDQLNVLVRPEAYGDAMWAPEFARGDVALLRVPLKAFGDGNDRVPWWRYRRLPAPADANHYTFHNRFVGRYLLYGQGSGWGRPRGDTATLFAVPWGDRDPAVTGLVLAHGVDRIEQMGTDAVIVGADSSDLQFTGIRLAEKPSIAQRYVVAGASQGEVRSHGFFYRMDGADSGVLGLPVREAGRAGYRHLFEGSAGIVFLRNSAQRFAPLGTLRASNKANNDRCRASCVDWYGNARPLFLRGRVFALLGYELVEGSIAGDSIQEVRRVSYAPGQQTVAR